MPAISGAGLSIIGVALEKLVPDLPDAIWVICLIVGCLLFAYWAVPAVNKCLAGHVGCLSYPATFAIFGIALAAIVMSIYNARAYKLSYRFCFNHDWITDEAGLPRIARIYVSPQLINKNSFVVFSQMTENTLAIEKAASEDRPAGDKAPIGANSAGWGYPDLVEFTPSRPPGAFNGKARYVFHDGKDPAKPLGRVMVIKGTITGGTSPNGKKGAFYFTPDLDSDLNYDPTPCVVSKDTYHVENK